MPDRPNQSQGSPLAEPQAEQLPEAAQARDWHLGRPAEGEPAAPELPGPARRAGRERLFNARDAVEYLGISLSTLNRIERQGLLVPFRTPGGHRRYGQQMLDEYLEGTRRPNGPRDRAEDK